MKTALIVLLVILSNALYAQWPKTYGHTTFDAIGRELKNSYDKGVLIGGAERIENGGQFKGYLRKTDINGNELWKRYFSNEGTPSVVLGISNSPNGGMLLSGQCNNNSITNGFALKLNACGEKEWCTIFDIPGYSYCFQNLQLPDGGYMILAGHQQYSYDRIWLYRLDSIGNQLWQKCIEPDTNYFDETGYNLLLTNDTGIMITGFNFYIQQPGSGLGWFSPFWVKMDIDGNQVWDLTWFTESGMGDFGQTIQDARGNYYSAGNVGYTDQPNYSCLFKISPDGLPIKKAAVFNSVTSTTTSITFFADSTLFMGGGYGNTPGSGHDHSMVIKVDTTGNVIKTKDVPLYGFPVAYSALTTDNKVFALGERYINSSSHWETCLFKFNQNLEYDSTYTVPRTYDSLCPYAVTPTATINLDCVTVNTEEPIKKPEGSRLKVYPLPATGIVTIALPEYYVMEENKFHIKTTTTYFQLNGGKTIEIINLLGQKTATYNIADGQTSIDFDVSNWAPGMYLARLICKGKVWAQGKVMVVR